MTLENVTTHFRGRVITVNVETVVLPNGHRAALEIIHHPGGAAVVAIDAAERVCLLRQYRHAAGGWVWELPAGKLEPPEPPLSTAQRELIEEAGVSASEWRPLGTSRRICDARPRRWKNRKCSKCTGCRLPKPGSARSAATFTTARPLWL